MMNRAEYKPMICPVCKDFYFTDLLEDDVNEEQFQCTQCGWVYSLHQVENPDWVDPSVKYSLNAYCEMYHEKKTANPTYNYTDEVYKATPHPCPVCGQTTFSDHASFEVCPFCGWEDDPVMEDEPDAWAGNANDLCLNEFRKRYYKALDKNPSYRFDKNGIPQ